MVTTNGSINPKPNISINLSHVILYYIRYTSYRVYTSVELLIIIKLRLLLIFVGFPLESKFQWLKHKMYTNVYYLQ